MWPFSSIRYKYYSFLNFVSPVLSWFDLTLTAKLFLQKFFRTATHWTGRLPHIPSPFPEVIEKLDQLAANESPFVSKLFQLCHFPFLQALLDFFRMYFEVLIWPVSVIGLAPLTKLLTRGDAAHWVFQVEYQVVPLLHAALKGNPCSPSKYFLVVKLR